MFKQIIDQNINSSLPDRNGLEEREKAEKLVKSCGKHRAKEKKSCNKGVDVTSCQHEEITVHSLVSI